MGMPLGAYGPVRYTSSGMNSSLPWASAIPASGAPTSAVTTKPTRTFLPLIRSSSAASMGAASNPDSMRKGPQPELLLRDLPQPCEAARLGDQEEDDERAEHHDLELLRERHGQVDAHGARRIGEEHRHEQDESRPEERTQDAAEPPDDHHEQDQERQRDVEGERLGAAEIQEHELRPRDAAIERAHGEGQELGAQR